VDQTELAKAFLDNMHRFRKLGHQKTIDETMRGEAFVVMYLSKRGGSVLPGEISGEMDISSARIAAVLNALENKGCVTRRIDRDDRRKILVDLTPAGRELAEKHERGAMEDATRMLDALGEHDAREFVRILGKLAGLFESKGAG